MTKVTFLPHETLCPLGKTIEVEPGQSILEAALAHDIQIDHACEMACACTTCHVIVRKGFNSLEEASEREEDLLDKAWGLESESRLSCQAIVEDKELVVEIPKYSINQVSENRK
ncbi:ISC system 2Fe-2S type ferredoxin [Candidatus Berkiella aquae]|uniref:2Fe-2S ferredoxin n=1 Tax=Candidatus Berkiella aquae TaxID=295108 RepID=A0A0Q9YC40_9GAMM|nr:ISC system 2Fe-2S type ferredoxin [Candidatus Berkiella aquae]MCS5711035.1 ISC system 2Fe-2S type ferredoxin [Candidatus Berkiella aquae]